MIPRGLAAGLFISEIKKESITAVLNLAIEIVESNIKLFEKTSRLKKDLSSVDVTQFEKEFLKINELYSKSSILDNDFNMWFKYFYNNRLALLSFYKKNKDKDSVNSSIKHNEDALKTITAIVEYHKQEKEYVNLYKGYIYRDLFKCYEFLKNRAETEKYAMLALDAHKDFYIHYEKEYTKDTFLIERFQEEYYLSFAFSLKYTKNSYQKKENQKIVDDFIKERENKKNIIFYWNK